MASNDFIIHHTKLRKIQFGPISKFVKYWDFSNRNLNQVPSELIDLLQNTKEDQAIEPVTDYIDLSNNNLEHIPPYINLSHISGLDLSHNELSTLPQEVDISNMVFLDLSYNNFKLLPSHFLKTSYNLIKLNLTGNKIEGVSLHELRKLAPIEYLIFDDNFVNNDINEKSIAAFRLGIYDIDDITYSKFKFQNVLSIGTNEDLSILDGRWDKRFLLNKQSFYVKYYEIVSVKRFDFYDNLEYKIHQGESDTNLNEGARFWVLFKEKMAQFGDLFLTSSKYDNYFILYLTNRDRISDFERFLPHLFGNTLVK